MSEELRLSPNERLILKHLTNEWSSGNEMEKKTSLPKDGVWRGAYFLSKKGLAEMKTIEEKRITLTEEGKKALHGELPELMIIEFNNKSVKEIPNELRNYIGQMKSLGILTIDSGIVNVNIERAKSNPIKKALESILNGEDVSNISNEIMDILKKRNYVEIKEIKEINVKLTNEGEKYKRRISESTDEIDVLSRDVIENGEWKKKSFRPYNISFDDVRPRRGGKIHPISYAIRRIKEIFISMGFEEMVGNYVEESFWNFDALFQPQDHPSRELADTFYIDRKTDKKIIPKDILNRVIQTHESGWRYKWKLEEALRLVLRTHTTVLSARTLYSKKTGKHFSIGRVFRNEAIDFKHLAEFHQIEGIISYPGVNLSNLMGVLKTFYNKLGFDRVRFRPSYFPYTEPSLEIEVYFEPKQEWMEIGGAGIFRKEVTDILGVDHPVLAWGLSLERPLMMLMGLEDIRAFYKNDMDWLEESKRNVI